MISSFYIRLLALFGPALIGYFSGSGFGETVIFTSYIFLLTVAATQKTKTVKPESKIRKFLGYNKYSQFLSI